MRYNINKHLEHVSAIHIIYNILFGVNILLLLRYELHILLEHWQCSRLKTSTEPGEVAVCSKNAYILTDNVINVEAIHLKLLLFTEALHRYIHQVLCHNMIDYCGGPIRVNIN